MCLVFEYQIAQYITLAQCAPPLPSSHVNIELGRMPQQSGMVVRPARGQGVPVGFEVGLLPQGPAVNPSISGVHSKNLLNDKKKKRGPGFRRVKRLAGSS